MLMWQKRGRRGKREKGEKREQDRRAADKAQVIEQTEGDVACEMPDWGSK